MFVANVALLR